MSLTEPKIFAPGNVIEDKWVVLDFIGKGAMGEVYRAHQLNLKRDVAIKVVSQEWLRSLEEDEREVENALQRFRREIQAMARIRHPNVLQIFDHGSTVIKNGNGQLSVEFIVMEYIPGETLRHTMSEEGFYPEQDLMKAWLEDYFLPLLDGLKAVHLMDVVHRDLKPENVLMDGRTPKLADFGLARSSRLKPVTQSMDVKGTAHYMSPEHFFDFRKADHLADIYSLGKILYEAIDGKIADKTLPLKTVSLMNPDTLFFQKLNEIVQKATAEKKEERFGSVDELTNALLSAIQVLKEKAEIAISPKTENLPYFHRPKWIWAGVALAVLSVGAMTAWHLMSKPEEQQRSQKMTPNHVENLSKVQLTENGKKVFIQPNGLTPTLLTEDGATLRLVQGGSVEILSKFTSEEKRVVDVRPFYMDEAPVTNHQYVEFLNHNLARVRLDGDVVSGDNEIWLLLGTVREGYTPIIFRNGEFKLTSATYASFPVLRVTALGASAYARFYDRRLPTAEEWVYVFGNGYVSGEISEQEEFKAADNAEMEKMHEMMVKDQNKADAPAVKNTKNPISPVSTFEANKYEIRTVPTGFGEWSISGMASNSKAVSERLNYILMPSGVKRQPWEAFQSIGFRSAWSIGKNRVKSD